MGIGRGGRRRRQGHVERGQGADGELAASVFAYEIDTHSMATVVPYS
jgi:hypothetical protein